MEGAEANPATPGMGSLQGTVLTSSLTSSPTRSPTDRSDSSRTERPCCGPSYSDQLVTPVRMHTEAIRAVKRNLFTRNWARQTHLGQTDPSGSCILLGWPLPYLDPSEMCSLPSLVPGRDKQKGNAIVLCDVGSERGRSRNLVIPSEAPSGAGVPEGNMVPKPGADTHPPKG